MAGIVGIPQPLRGAPLSCTALPAPHREVCGYPATVHGGMTAAIIDESLGGLYTCMLTSGSLGVRLPALTARLEVDYRNKIPAGSIILVQVGKIWHGWLQGAARLAAGCCPAALSCSDGAVVT
jgi:hypothetical protein